jgi:hypothetical protein
MSATKLVSLAAATAMLCAGAPLSYHYPPVRAGVPPFGLARGGDARHRPTSAGPTITGLSLLTTTVQANTAPASPLLQVKFTNGVAGLANVNFAMTSPSGAQTVYGYTTYGTALKSGTVIAGGISPWADFAWGPYSEPGLWTVTYIDAVDLAGNDTYLDQAQVQALLGSSGVTVTNTGTPDVAPPLVSAAKILTPKVSIGAQLPYVRFSAQASDDLSGVYEVYIQAQDTAGDYLFVFSQGPYATKETASGAADVSQLPPGTYTVTDLEACDNAGNCNDYTGTQLSTLFKGKIKIVLTP